MKNYVVAPYTEYAGKVVYAMFEENDFRVSDKEVVTGTYTKTKSVKGMVNGHEVGIFNGDNGKTFVVFTDYTVKEVEV